MPTPYEAFSNTMPRLASPGPIEPLDWLGAGPTTLWPSRPVVYLGRHSGRLRSGCYSNTAVADLGMSLSSAGLPLSQPASNFVLMA